MNFNIIFAVVVLLLVGYTFLLNHQLEQQRRDLAKHTDILLTLNKALRSFNDQLFLVSRATQADFTSLYTLLYFYIEYNKRGLMVTAFDKVFFAFANNFVKNIKELYDPELAPTIIAENLVKQYFETLTPEAKDERAGV